MGRKRKSRKQSLQFDTIHPMDDGSERLTVHSTDENGIKFQKLVAIRRQGKVVWSIKK